MFTFFRKDKGAKKPVIPDSRKPTAMPPLEAMNRPAVAPPPPPAPLQKPESPPPPPRPVVATKPAPSITANNGFLVQEIDFTLAPEVEDAVMLYANGRTGEATAALNRYILNNPDSRDPQPWRMLFDIYEVTGQRQPFEDLAMDFAVRFERSPPTWRPVNATPSAAAAGNNPTFAFGASLSPQDKAGLEHFLQECETADTVVLDFNKTPVPGNETYARAILDCMSRIAASGKAIRLLGSEGFAVRLNASRADGRLSETLWLLLLMLLQLQGKADAFEAAAVEYAVRFEISPPSFTPPKHVSAEPESEGAAVPSGHVFPMQGLIGPGASASFDALSQFAAPLPSIEIDLGQVSRIDFTVVGLLMDTVMNLVQAGKKVIFKEGNEMICLLLQMVGVNQFAVILPKIRK